MRTRKPTRATCGVLRAVSREPDRHAERRHQDHRACRLSDDDVQIADDLQSVVREARNQRRRRAARRQKRRFRPRLSGDLPLHQFPRRVDHHAAQDCGYRPHRRGVDRGQGRGLMQRGPPQRRGPAGRRHVRRRRVRARNGATWALAQGQEGSRRRVGRSGLGDRRLVRGRRRGRDRALRRERRRDGGARGAAQAELSAAQGYDSDRTTRPGSTSSSTRRRSA